MGSSPGCCLCEGQKVAMAVMLADRAAAIGILGTGVSLCIMAAVCMALPCCISELHYRNLNEAFRFSEKYLAFKLSVKIT